MSDNEKRANDPAMGELHGLLAKIYGDGLKTMVTDGDYDVQLLKSAQAFLKDNNITSNLVDSPALQDIQSAVIEIDESSLPVGHNFKRVVNE
jgi:hypothetical protein